MHHALGQCSSQAVLAFLLSRKHRHRVTQTEKRSIVYASYISIKIGRRRRNYRKNPTEFKKEPFSATQNLGVWF